MAGPERRRALLTCTILAGALGACVPAYEGDGPDAGALLKDHGLASDSGADDGSATEDALAYPDAAAPDAEPPPVDTDTDGIPDSEDPEPARVNPLLLRDQFDDTSNGWIFTSVSIGVRGPMSLLSTDVLEPYVREGWIGPRAAWADYYLRTQLRVRQAGISADQGSGRAGVFVRAQQVSPDRYYLCTVDAKANLLVLTEHNGGGAAGSLLASAPVTVPRDQWLRMGVSLRGTRLTCSALGAEVSSTSNTFGSGSVGFRSLDATFDADWVEVYEIL